MSPANPPTTLRLRLDNYKALAAGDSIDIAYKLGCNAIAMARIPENLTQLLKVKPNHRQQN